MEIVEAAAKLRPGTSWNYRGGNVVEQADDATPRVIPPSIQEINDFIAANQVVSEVPVKNQLSAIWDYLRTLGPNLPASTKTVLDQLDTIQVATPIIDDVPQ